MPSTIQLLHYARGLSTEGTEDLHLRMLSRQAERRKALLTIIDELIDVSVETALVGMMRGAPPAIEVEPECARRLTLGCGEGGDKETKWPKTHRSPKACTW